MWPVRGLFPGSLSGFSLPPTSAPVPLASWLFLRPAGPVRGSSLSLKCPFPRYLHDSLPQPCQVLTKKSRFHQKSSSWSVVPRPLFVKLYSTPQYVMCPFHALVFSLVFIIFKHTRYLLLCLSLYSLLPNSGLNWRKWRKPLDHSGMT